MLSRLPVRKFCLRIGMQDPIRFKHRYCLSQLSLLLTLTRHDSYPDRVTNLTKDVFEYRRISDHFTNTIRDSGNQVPVTGSSALFQERSALVDKLPVDPVTSIVSSFTHQCLQPVPLYSRTAYFPWLFGLATTQWS